MGVVDQPVQDGVGQGRVADLFVPEFQGRLATLRQTTGRWLVNSLKKNNKFISNQAFFS